MSQQDGLFPPHTTILRTPSWAGNGITEDHALLLTPGDYQVTPGADGGRWTVTCLKTHETVYHGKGPVEVLRAQG